ncbi:MOB kinase activator-like 2 isoform X2 [Uloborus diversus]|uniref:MOB kinase activator-like 2 isoform X2 n=1 Tax=Uloborus diversus TaxID=327109 RepID=UPI00240A65C9|nr:MOB kinase activator-like 2 isoform X2 [Uloborus diversus]
MIAHYVKNLVTNSCFKFRKARRRERDAVATSQEESKLYLEQAVLEVAVPESRLREVIDLPAGLDYNEWLASHTIAFFDHTNLVYGTISEFCTMSGCPDMTGPNGRQYLWFDEKGKKCKVAAPQYIDCVMTFTQRTLYDETIFPTKFDRDFPSSFESIVKKIQRLLFHVMAHIYHVHFKEILLLNMHAHLNALFSHFTLFNERFKIVDEKETEILGDLAVALKLYGESTSVDASTESEDKNKPSTSAAGDAAATAVIDDDNAEESIKDCNVSRSKDNTKRPPAYSQSSQSIASSISLALHSRSSSGSHSSSGSCAMDSALYSHGTPPAPNFGSSPLKF